MSCRLFIWMSSIQPPWSETNKLLHLTRFQESSPLDNCNHGYCFSDTFPLDNTLSDSMLRTISSRTISPEHNPSGQYPRTVFPRTTDPEQYLPEAIPWTMPLEQMNPLQISTMGNTSVRQCSSWTTFPLTIYPRTVSLRTFSPVDQSSSAYAICHLSRLPVSVVTVINSTYI